MSDEEVTEQKPQADGSDCPAAQPLCLRCGVRGCTTVHVPAKTKTRRWRRTS